MSSEAAHGIVTHLGVVQPWFCDAMGHMNTQFYVMMYDAASFHFMAALTPPDALRAARRGWADVKQTIEYRHEARAGALVTITSRVLRVGGKSLTYVHEMRGTQSGALHSFCENVTVLFDLEARKALTLDETVRAAAGALL